MPKLSEKKRKWTIRHLTNGASKSKRVSKAVDYITPNEAYKKHL